jgi:acetyltransferase-like isoleucine patch superfamily enzyme
VSRTAGSAPSLDWPDLPGAAADLWDRSPLPANVRVGEGCRMERTAQMFGPFRTRRDPGLVLGDGVQVYHWTTFSVERDGIVRVGDGSILVGAILMCAEEITIGREAVLSYNVVVADCDFHPLDPELRRQDAVANAPDRDRRQRPRFDTAPVAIEDGAWLGVGAIVLKGVRIGAEARVAAGSVVTREVPAGASVAGNPAEIAA